MLKDPRTTVFLLIAILLVAMWRTGKLNALLNLALGK